MIEKGMGGRKTITKEEASRISFAASVPGSLFMCPYFICEYVSM
jgi:hypothetical protein